ncbi:MAG: DUF971 domain-containing protein [Acidimicrobiales bacterium]
MPSSAEAQVANVTVEKSSHVELVFADGRTCRFALGELRAACPCATCRTTRDRGRESWPPAGRPDADLAIASAELVGAYALGIMWSDGHSTGIYPFASLRQWCDAGRSSAAFPADSGLPG